MYYIFNSEGKCVASCNYKPNEEYLNARNEVCSETGESYNISSIVLANGMINQITQSDSDKLIAARNSKISEIKSLLKETDYQAIKFAEGIITLEQYSDIKAAREAWRSAINSIESTTTIAQANKITYSTNIPTVKE